MDSLVASLRQELLEHRPWVALTGAGISAASGIPTYRDHDVAGWGANRYSIRNSSKTPRSAAATGADLYWDGLGSVKRTQMKLMLL